MNFIASHPGSQIDGNAVRNINSVIATTVGELLREDVNKSTKKAGNNKNKKPRKRSPKKHSSGTSTSAQEPQVIVQTPLTTDVILGRGAPLTKHPGNVRYREIVADHRAVYATAARTDKLKIAATVVQKFRQEGGRFLEKNGAGGWKDIGDKRATDKTAQTLREGQPLIRLKILEQKCSRKADESAKVAAKLVESACEIALAEKQSKEPSRCHKEETAKEETAEEDSCTDPQSQSISKLKQEEPQATTDIPAACPSQQESTPNRRDFFQRMSSVDSLLVETCALWDQCHDSDPAKDIDDDVGNISLKTKSQKGGIDILPTIADDEGDQRVKADPALPSLVSALTDKDNVLSKIEEYMEGEFIDEQEDTDDDIASLVTATTVASNSQFADATSFMSDDEEDRVISFMPILAQEQGAKEHKVDRRSIMRSLQSSSKVTKGEHEESTNQPEPKCTFDRREFFKNTKCTNLSETSLGGLSEMLDPIQMWRDSFRRGLPVVGTEAESLARVANMAASADNIGEDEASRSSTQSDDEDRSHIMKCPSSPILKVHSEACDFCPSTPEGASAMNGDALKDELFELASTVTPTAGDDCVVTSLFASTARTMKRPPFRRAVSDATEPEDRVLHHSTIPSRLNNLVAVDQQDQEDNGTAHENRERKGRKASKRRSDFVVGSKEAFSFGNPSSGYGLSVDSVHFQTLENMRRYESETAQYRHDASNGGKYKKRRSV